MAGELGGMRGGWRGDNSRGSENERENHAYPEGRGMRGPRSAGHDACDDREASGGRRHDDGGGPYENAHRTRSLLRCGNLWAVRWWPASAAAEGQGFLLGLTCT